MYRALLVPGDNQRTEGKGVVSAGGKQVPLDRGSQQTACHLQGSLHLLRLAVNKIHVHVHRPSTKDTGGKERFAFWSYTKLSTLHRTGV